MFTIYRDCLNFNVFFLPWSAWCEKPRSCQSRPPSTSRSRCATTSSSGTSPSGVRQIPTSMAASITDGSSFRRNIRWSRPTSSSWRLASYFHRFRDAVKMLSSLSFVSALWWVKPTWWSNCSFSRMVVSKPERKSVFRFPAIIRNRGSPAGPSERPSWPSSGSCRRLATAPSERLTTSLKVCPITSS